MLRCEAPCQSTAPRGRCSPDPLLSCRRYAVAKNRGLALAALDDQQAIPKILEALCMPQGSEGTHGSHGASKVLVLWPLALRPLVCASPSPPSTQMSCCGMIWRACVSARATRTWKGSVTRRCVARAVHTCLVLVFPAAEQRTHAMAPHPHASQPHHIRHSSCACVLDGGGSGWLCYACCSRRAMSLRFARWQTAYSRSIPPTTRPWRRWTVPPRGSLRRSQSTLSTTAAAAARRQWKAARPFQYSFRHPRKKAGSGRLFSAAAGMCVALK